MVHQFGCSRLLPLFRPGAADAVFLRLCTVKHSEAGLTLTELLVVVAILSISAAISLPSFLFVLRRERVNATALEVAGWLEEARSQSAREVNQAALAAGLDDSEEGGCVIILGGPTSNAKTGDIIATVESVSVEGCDVRQKNLIIPDTQGELLRTAVFGLGSGSPESDPLNPCTPAMAMRCEGSVSLFFTPRGMWSSTSIEAGQNLEVRIAHADGAGPKRCVRISSIIGSIDIGRGSSGDLASSCDNWVSI